MQNQTVNPLTFIRLILMAVGIVLFLIFGNWSIAHMDDQSMARGDAGPVSFTNVNSLLPR